MKVPFIGNSYTYCNDLPGIVRQVSAAAGQSFETVMVASGGMRWNGTGTIRRPWTPSTRLHGISSCCRTTACKPSRSPASCTARRPVGPAWCQALALSPGLSLHVEDRSHPNLLGSYPAACVFYATLFGRTPVGLSNTFRLSGGVAAVIDKDMAALLQQVAWASVQELGNADTQGRRKSATEA